ncbi:MAG: hypothetical protein Q7I99_03990 [Acholeplasmataceae bacterium]|nr:hypothetical protein [Acholeplasmataceae bacterium]
MIMKRVATFFILLIVTFLVFSKNLESLANSKESSLSYIHAGTSITSTILRNYIIPNINFYQIIMIGILIIIAIIFLIISSAIFWIIKLKLSRYLQITYKNKDLSILADVFLIIGTPIAIFYFLLNSDKVLRAAILILTLLFLNTFLFIKKESRIKYILLTLALLIVFSGLYFLLLILFVRDFISQNS